MTPWAVGVIGCVMRALMGDSGLRDGPDPNERRAPRMQREAGVPGAGLEPATLSRGVFKTPAFPFSPSGPETQQGADSTEPPPRRFRFRAGNGTRTRDPNLGKVVLY